MVDGIICLTDELVVARSERRLQVLKLRGSPFLQGVHGFRITDDGLVVTPRLEAAAETGREQPTDFRMPTGIAKLDDMICGGLPGNSITLIMGPTGSGKTTAGLVYLSKATPEQPGLFFGCYEQPERIKKKARSLGIDVDSLVASGALTIGWQKPFESFLDEMADHLLAMVKRTGARRLFIDGIGGFRQVASQPERLIAFFSALSLRLRQEGVTAACSIEIPPGGGATSISMDDLSPLAENIILLRYAEHKARLLRAVSVLKVRDSQFDSSIMPFEITDHGIVIGDPLDGIEAILRGGVLSAPSGR